MNTKMVQQSKAKTNKKALCGAKWLRLILWIFAILVLGLVFKILWVQYSGQNSFVTKQIASFENTVSTLSQETPSESAARSVINSLDEKTFMDLQVRDAYFMARIAATILKNDRDITVAIELLNTAQEHLNNLQGEKIDQAKIILADNIAKLASIQSYDTNSLQDQLTLLDKLAVILPLKHEFVDEAQNTIASKDVASKDVDKNTWHQSIQDIISEAKSVVKIRKKPASDAPLSDVTIEIKRAQFRLFIEQIRWALFYKDPEVYNTSIVKLQHLLPEIFDSNSDSVKRFAAVLSEMSQAQINVDVPDIQDSVNALKALLIG